MRNGSIERNSSQQRSGGRSALEFHDDALPTTCRVVSPSERCSLPHSHLRAGVCARGRLLLRVESQPRLRAGFPPAGRRRRASRESRRGGRTHRTLTTHYNRLPRSPCPSPRRSCRPRCRSPCSPSSNGQDTGRHSGPTGPDFRARSAAASSSEPHCTGDTPHSLVRLLCLSFRARRQEATTGRDKVLRLVSRGGEQGHSAKSEQQRAGRRSCATTFSRNRSARSCTDRSHAPSNAALPL